MQSAECRVQSAECEALIGDILALARSHRGSDMPPAYYSTPRRRFAMSSASRDACVGDPYGNLNLCYPRRFRDIKCG